MVSPCMPTRPLKENQSRTRRIGETLAAGSISFDMEFIMSISAAPLQGD